MRRAVVVACAAVAALAGFGAAGAPAAGLAGPVIADWGSTATSLRGQNGSQFAVVCPAGGALAAVWGTDTYTDDSSVCSAAAHAGMVSQAAGGSATIEIRPGAASYTGSARNGVTSKSYGSFGGSFVFVRGTSGGGAGVNMGGAGWTAKPSAFRTRAGQRFAFVCPAGGTVVSPWGTDTYTDDSSVCSAAVHVGLISVAAGGTVTIEMRPGLSSYTGSTHNGVTSRNYGSWGGSFVFPGATQVGTGTITTPPSTTTRPPATTTATPAGVGAGGSGWAADTRAYRGRVGARYSYACPAGGRASTVWGTNVYTDDSSVCNAAVHMGLISKARGGTVTVEIRAGLSSYTGSTRNGITTHRYGAWSGSYVFVGRSTTTPPTTTATGGTSWTADTRAYRGKIGSVYRFVCPAGGRASVVWGTDNYTDDSSVCTAAVHAGLIGFARGGTVTVRVTAGLSSYVGSTRNGVTTKAYGAWHGTFVFAR